MKMNPALQIVIITCGIILASVYFFRSRIKTPSQVPYNVSVQETDTVTETVEARTRGMLEKRFDKFGLSKHWPFFKEHLRNEILAKLSTVNNEEELKPGQSKMGGRPDMSTSIDWFREDNGKPLSFIAQINLADIAVYDSAKQLPSKGILYFFYSAAQEAWGFDKKDQDKFKVYYCEDISGVIRKEFPASLPKEARYKPAALSFLPSVSLPSYEQDYVSDRLNKTEQDKYFDAIESVYAETNKLLGHSDNIQGTMELECQLVTNGLYCGDASGFNDPRAKALEKGADDWILLFQVDSNDECDMMWGDVGVLYFWIRKDDLKHKRFEKCWMILQCS